MGTLREGRRWYTATVHSIEEHPGALSSLQREVILHDARDGDGTLLPDMMRVSYTGTLIGLGLAPGDRLIFTAQLAAYDREGGRIAAGIADVAAWRAALPPGSEEQVYLRFLVPRRVRRAP